MNKLKTILVGADFSDCSRSALEQAVRLAKWNHAHLHALHSVEYLTLSDAAYASHIPQERLEQDAVAEAKQRLQRWLGRRAWHQTSHLKVMIEANSSNRSQRQGGPCEGVAGGSLRQTDDLTNRNGQ